VLVVEDLHWVDRTSEEYLATLVDVVAGARILLVTTHRPGYRPPWMDRSYATQVALQPLSTQECLSLARDVIGPAAVDEPTVEDDRRQGRGNPFFTEELAGRWRRAAVPAPGSVPDTVEGVPHGPHRPPGAPRTSASSRPRRSSGGTSPFSCCRRSWSRGRGARERLARLQGAEFLYETRRGLRARVHLQARADARGRLREPPAGAAASASRADRRRSWKAGSAKAGRSSSSGWPITRSRPSPGKRRSTTRGAPGARR
jgi:hypothetical protein